MAKKLIALVEGASLFDGDKIDPEAFRNLMNAVRPLGEPEMTLEEAKAALAEESNEDDEDDPLE